jgi:Ca2+-binding RTX toxin-like protein
VLVFTNAGATMGDIAGSYDSATGVLALTSAGGAATLAQWQAALRSVAYDNASDTPDTSNRVVSVTISDGALSATVSPTVTVAALDDAPSLGGAGGTTAFTEGASAAVAPALTVADPDSTTLASATVAITGNFHAAEDVLAFTNSSSTIFGNVVGSYNSGTGVLTLTSSGATATLAQWQAALQAVTYADSSDAPNTALRVISFTANDGTASSSAATQTVTVAGVDDAPTLGGAGGTTAFTEGAAVAVASGLTVADADNATLTSASVSVTGGFHAGQDVLAFVNDGSTMGNVAASYNAMTGVLALSSSGGTATLAQWQAALRAVTYNNSSDALDLANRTLSFVVSDGTASATAATQTVTVTGVNDAPAGANATVSIQQDTTKVFAAADFGFTDVDGGSLAGVKIATLPLAGALTDNGVAVTAGQVVSAADIAGGKLVFTPMAGATGSAYASFTFQVQDNGGVANSGVDLDPTPNTVTIDVHAPMVSPPPPPPPPPPPSGTAGPDVIVLDGSVATLFAGEGADTVTGSFASETIDGGSGDDAIHGGGGDDEIIGGSGANYLRGDAGDDVIRGGDGFDDAHGNMGNDTVSGGGGDDWVVGGKGDDVLHGDEGGDVVYGNLGDDTLDGGLGGDVLRGGQGADLLEGGAGNDFLAGDRGDDTLTGGGGADVFHAWAGAGIDRVTDFNAAEGDRVEILAGDAYTVSQAGADVQIAFADGSRMVLAGVQLATLPSGWIFSA